MTGWSDLFSLGLTVRPFPGTPPPLGYRRSQFSASFTRTVELLARELRLLDASQVVLQMALRDRDIRLDGLPRADARPHHDGIALVFDSKHGPLTYATGEYDFWADNLRAIALSLEALRSVDRYGVSKRGEQYKGWRALTTGSDDTGIHTEEQAAAFLTGYGGLTAAIKATHPDAGGDPDEFRRVMRAKELVS